MKKRGKIRNVNAADLRTEPNAEPRHPHVDPQTNDQTTKTNPTGGGGSEWTETTLALIRTRTSPVRLVLDSAVLCAGGLGVPIVVSSRTNEDSKYIFY